MSKSMIMLLNEAQNEGVKELRLGKSQKKMLEKELKHSYAKEDYENLSKYKDILLRFSDEDFMWSIESE